VNQTGTATTLLTPGGERGENNTVFASSPNTSSTATSVLQADSTNFATENTTSSASVGGGGGSKRHYQMNSTLSTAAAMQPLCLRVNDDSITAGDNDVAAI